MKLWIDDVRPAPEGYVWIKTVNAAKALIRLKDINGSAPEGIELIDIDHDAGDCISNGGDYIRLLDWLEETGRNERKQKVLYYVYYYVSNAPIYVVYITYSINMVKI